jgi:hypothetical protein
MRGIFYSFAYVVNPERRKRHSHFLKQLPRHFMCDALAETGIANGPLLHKAMKFIWPDAASYFVLLQASSMMVPIVPNYLLWNEGRDFCIVNWSVENCSNHSIF